MSKLKEGVKKTSKSIFNGLKTMSKSNKIMLVVIILLIACPIYAQNTGSSAIGDAVTKIKSYWANVKLLIYAIGTIAGLIGALRIYNKWTNGDQDVNKEIMGWGGACLFLTLAPSFVEAFFQ